MGVRFRKSIKITKGVKVNIGKTGISATVGTRGLHHTVHSSGKKTTSVGIPGTGLSYVETSGGGRRRSSAGKTNRSVSQSAGRALEQEEEYRQNCEMVDDYQELIDRIQSIHKVCSEFVDWISIRSRPAPYDGFSIGPNEKEARKAMEDSRPGFLERFMPSAEKKRMQSLSDAVEEAKEKDRRMYVEWEELHNLAVRVLDGDIDSYFQVISEWQPFEDILDFGSDFDIEADDPESVVVEFHAKTTKVVPNHVLSLTKTGKLSSKIMTKTMHFDIAQDYICSCTLRIAREMFALLPVNKVLIHAVDTMEEAGGIQKEETVLSVLIQRDAFMGIDFDAIDPSDTIETFDHHMEFKKTRGLMPVDRIEI